MRARSAHLATTMSWKGRVASSRLLAPSPVLFIASEHMPANGGDLDMERGCLRPDDGDGMRQVVDHLIERGYRSVAYVSGSSGATQIIRRDALVAALAARRQAAPTVHTADEVDAAGLRGVVIEIKQSRPDVIVCYDDKTALLLMDELRSAGLSVPDDVAVVGFDDIPFARISNPRLTTVSQRADDLGRTSVDLLLSTIERGRLPVSKLMPVTLVVRETTPSRKLARKKDRH